MISCSKNLRERKNFSNFAANFDDTTHHDQSLSTYHLRVVRNTHPDGGRSAV